MKIGLSGGAATVDKLIDQAVRAEAEGFTALWYASAIAGDPLVAMALAGRATTSIELGTSVLQTYTSHPVLQANRAISVADSSVNTAGERVVACVMERVEHWSLVLASARGGPATCARPASRCRSAFRRRGLRSTWTCAVENCTTRP